eukprot:3295206-Prymnesium_polylepis.1
MYNAKFLNAVYNDDNEADLDDAVVDDQVCLNPANLIIIETISCKTCEKSPDAHDARPPA